jgi:hypothetical protein
MNTSHGKSPVVGVVSHDEPELLDDEEVLPEHSPPRQPSSSSAVHEVPAMAKMEARPRSQKRRKCIGGEYRKRWRIVGSKKNSFGNEKALRRRETGAGPFTCNGA